MHMSKTKAVDISFTKDMLDRIDNFRGKIPRSVYIRDLIEKALEK
jgi:metal-responsive CopG/Arc/MetJ family transcriptional regulator